MIFLLCFFRWDRVGPEQGKPQDCLSPKLIGGFPIRLQRLPTASNALAWDVNHVQTSFFLTHTTSRKVNASLAMGCLILMPAGWNHKWKRESLVLNSDDICIEYCEMFNKFNPFSHIYLRNVSLNYGVSYVTTTCRGQDLQSHFPPETNIDTKGIAH